MTEGCPPWKVIHVPGNKLFLSKNDTLNELLNVIEQLYIKYELDDDKETLTIDYKEHKFYISTDQHWSYILIKAVEFDKFSLELHKNIFDYIHRIAHELNAGQQSRITFTYEEEGYAKAHCAYELLWAPELKDKCRYLTDTLEIMIQKMKNYFYLKERTEPASDFKYRSSFLMNDSDDNNSGYNLYDQLIPVLEKMKLKYTFVERGLLEFTYKKLTYNITALKHWNFFLLSVTGYDTIPANDKKTVYNVNRIIDYINVHTISSMSLSFLYEDDNELDVDCLVEVIFHPAIQKRERLLKDGIDRLWIALSMYDNLKYEPGGIFEVLLDGKEPEIKA